MKTLLKILTAIVLCCSLVSSCSYTIYKNIELKQNCIGYLEQAANANTIELAKASLSKAITYIEKRDLTDGYTSVIYKTPDEDISFWYKNLIECQNELNCVTSKTTQLEKSNILLKLRETLVSTHEGNSVVIYPNGLSVYPLNLLLGLAASIPLITLMFICIINIEFLRE